jgi:hypothetical protein
MRVLMTTDTVGGVWTYSLDLIRSLRAAGVDVLLATMGAPLRDDQRRDAAAAGPAALYESEFALEWMTSPWQEVDAAGEWLLEIARTESVDLVHSSSYAHGTLEWGRPVVVVGHSCVVSWWRAVHGTDPPPEWDAYRARVKAGLTAADAVVAPTAAMLRELEQAYGLTAGAVIPNGTSLAETDSDREAFVFAAGRMWDRAKGLDLLDAAAARLAWPVLVAGDGGRAQHVRALGRLAPDDLAAIRARLGD